MLFARWGAFVYRFRRPVALVALVLGIASLGFASQASGQLSSGGWLDKDAQSATVADRVANEFGAGRSNIVVLFRSSSTDDAMSPAFQAAVATALRDVEADDRVSGIVGYAQTGDRRFVSESGKAAYSVIELNLTNEQSVAAVAPLRARIHPPAGLTFQLTGYGPVTRDSAEQSEIDLQRAETVSLPIAGLILVLVFLSIVAAGMPLLVAGLAIPSSLAIIYFVAQRVEMSVFVLNIATMLGLALAIDYSLFIVSRFREELRRGRTVAEAVERAVATSGKAVAFSGLAVAIGLSGLLAFTAPALRSIGLAGSIVVFCSVFYALTFLPAVLGMLGPAVNGLPLRAWQARARSIGPAPARALAVGLLGVPLFLREMPGRAVRAIIRPFVPARLRQGGGHRWESVARAVMRRPLLVLVPTLALLLAAGAPFLRLQQGVPGAEIYPAGLESRDAYVALQSEFPRGETTPIVVLANVTGSPTEAKNVRALADLAARIEAVPGIDRVESPFSMPDPTTGASMTPEAVAALFATPRSGLPPAVATGLDRLLATYVRGSTVRLDAISPIDPAKPAATDLIPIVRGLDPGPGIKTEVGGSAALAHDFLVAQANRAPWGVGIPLVASAIILFLLFGSLVIPIKAVLMTLLSISASFGALVWIFQEGHFAKVLHFDPLGYTIAGNPIIMFSVLFGLSMDYEVLLLSRVQEAWRRTHDNAASVAEGLARTAGIITGAALIMITVFAAFALADVITIKSIGVGMAIAVFIDATIIRVLLVPATMRLLGGSNWWAPGFLSRIVDGLGFSHAEDEAFEGPGTASPVPTEG
jgi:RND superfamily putative drug exporter